MVNRAPWYKQLKSIIPTNIPNQKARPRIKKMSINYKSQKKDFAFFHCSPPKKKDKSQKKDFAFFHCFPPKKDKSQEKNLHYFLFFLQKKAKSQKKNLHYFSFFS